MRKTIAWLILVILSAAELKAQTPDKPGSRSLSKNSASLTWQVLNINNLWTWHRSDGVGNNSPAGRDGLVYPVFTASCIYEDNMVFGGIMYLNGFPENGGTKASYQPIRVNGGTYYSGMVQGWVDGQGSTATPHDPNDPAVHIYRIRRDYQEMTEEELKRDAAISFEQQTISTVTQSMIDHIRNQYHADWKEWPVAHGAPFIDRNGNGVYDPPPEFSPTFTADSLVSAGYDEPGVAGEDLASPADQVLYTVYNGLDRFRSLAFEGSEPIGMEVQKTVFGYDRTDGLGDAYFVRYRLINKGGVDLGDGTKGAFFLDSLFLGQWEDPDLGYAGDDLLGCDSILGLWYAYNGYSVDRSYQAFHLPPPAIGYDILGGALMNAAGDSGIFNFKKIYGKKNRQLDSFGYYGSGGAYSDPPFSNYERGTWQWWVFIQGYAPYGSFSTPYYLLFPHPPGYPPSRFPFSGDPLAGGGFIDGLGTNYSSSPGDRIMLGNTSPFRMAPSDTQEIYVGFVAGMGSDNLSSVAVLRTNDRVVQEMFESGFATAGAPRKPHVRVIELDGAILLDWSFDIPAVNATEESVLNPGGYEFEGYNLYQLPSAGAGLNEATRIATFDRVNGVKTISGRTFDFSTGQYVFTMSQQGTDRGVARFVLINKDYLRDIAKLYNGEEYFFAVTAYSRATTAGYSSALESRPAFITARPRIPFGVGLVAATGDTIPASHAAGNGEGSVSVTVVNPLAITGDTYEVRFDSSGTWGVYNSSKGAWAVTGLTNRSGNSEYPLVDGFVPIVKESPTSGIAFDTSDTFVIITAAFAPQSGPDVVKNIVQRIGVYPNPYSAGTTSLGSEPRLFVTFTNLPAKVIIRIFNLAGQLVRTLRKDDPSQFYRWNLTNEQNWQVASGIYICHIEMPEIGESKVLKLAVVQSQLFGPN